MSLIKCISARNWITSVPAHSVRSDAYLLQYSRWQREICAASRADHTSDRSRNRLMGANSTWRLEDARSDWNAKRVFGRGGSGRMWCASPTHKFLGNARVLGIFLNML